MALLVVLAVLLALAWRQHNPMWLLLVPALGWLWLAKAASLSALGCDDNGWWCCSKAAQVQPFTIHSSTVCRASLVKLQYGRWPWQYWLLRADQFHSAEDFKALRRCVYRDLHL